MLALSEPGDRVFDPYMGVGTSVVAAFMHDRVGYGCDVVAAYLTVARERIRELSQGTLQTRPLDRAVYDPSLPYGGQW